jgi:putative aldouronate transport system substrate-binding protein
VEFATGNKPLAEFDSFLREVERLGLARYLALKQQGYDRAK